MTTEEIDVSQFAEAVHAIVAESIEGNEAVMREDVRKAGEAARDWLRKNAPHDPDSRFKRGVNKGKTKTTHYRDGWKSYYSDRMPFLHLVTATVATKHEPSLTHLLEFGHAKFIHGRDTGKRVPAHPHISEAYDVGKRVLEGAKVAN